VKYEGGHSTVSATPFRLCWKTQSEPARSTRTTRLQGSEEQATFKFDVVWGNLGFLLTRIQMTLLVSVPTLSCALVLGLVVALARRSRRKWLHFPAVAYVETFRNTPTLFQLMWGYCCLPILTGLELGTVASATIALTLNG
jgi:polar amino acid transport system permease protein